MGAHSAPGHHPGHTVTAAAGVAAVLVTTATTGVLAGGTAFATDGSDGPARGHSHGGHSRGSHGHHDVDESDGQVADSADVLASQTLCDVLGDVQLDVGVSCPCGVGPSAGQGQDGGTVRMSPAAQAQDVSAASSGTQRVAAAQAPTSSAPAPRFTSAVPNHPQLLPITGSR